MEESDKHNRLHIQLSSLGHSYLQIKVVLMTILGYHMLATPAVS